MILLLSPSEKVARALTGRLGLRGGSSHFLGRNDSHAVAAVPARISEACGAAGYLLGLLQSSSGSASEIALAPVAVPPAAAASLLPRGNAPQDSRPPHPAEAPTIGFSVDGADEQPRVYVDPLFTGELVPGSIHSPLLRELLGWASGVLPTDMLYPLFLPRGEGDPRAIDVVATYLLRLAEELPETRRALSEDDERLLLAIAEALRLSHAGKERLLRAGRDRVIRTSGLPGELHGYADLRCATRQEGERVLPSVLELLSEEAHG